MRSKTQLVITFFVSFFILGQGFFLATPLRASELSDAIMLRIEFDEGSVWGDTGDARLIKVFDFYERRGYAPVFVGDAGVNPKGKALVEALKACAIDGLTPADYKADELAAKLGVNDITGLADLEIQLAKALIAYGHDLSAGRLKPHKVNRELYIYPEGPGPAQLLRGADVAQDLTGYLDDLAPASPNYARLKQKLAVFRKTVAQGGWIEVPSGDTLKPGMRQKRVRVLRQRLLQSGHLQAQNNPVDLETDGDLFDAALSEAVKVFQFRHGLTRDGAVGPNTLKALNVSARDRVKTMELNMERRRWMDDDLGEKYVFVNLADFWLKVVDGRHTIHTAPVVVGKTFHRTPVFSKEMKYIVFNPFWNVPRSIAVNEYLPKLRRDPGALLKQNIKLISNSGVIDPYSVDWNALSSNRFPYRLRQDSGKRNALGLVKFLFPNKHNVYIHDTPSKSLFSRTVRSFSHGCIRVKNPHDLAVILLKNQANWSEAKIKSSIASGKRRIVRLENPIPVHITYLTSWVNKDGTVYFRNDIYGRDKRLAKALQSSRVLVQTTQIEN